MVNIMTEFEDIAKGEFFIIDSNNLNLVNTKLYGYFIEEGQIIRDFNFTHDIELSPIGSYVYVKKTDEKISIYQDFDGCYGIYLFSGKNGEFCISNSFLYLMEYVAPNQSLSLNEDYAKSYLTSVLCSFAYRQTLANEIESLPRNYVIHIDLKTKEIEYEVIDYKENSIALNSKEGIDVLDDWFYRWTSLFHNLKKQTNNIQADLSGGFDTRVVFSLLIASGIDLNEITINSINDKKYVHEADFKIASKIADEFNFKLNDNSNLDFSRYYFQEIETPIDISFYSKLGFHNQMYFQLYKNISPFYSITGFGGEIIRGYGSETYDSFISYAREISLDFVQPTRNILNSNIDKFKRQFGKDNVIRHFNLIQYKEVRRNYHYSKANVEKYLGNTVNLTPLTDMYLNQLITSNEHCEDSKLLIAIIILRYCPKLLDFEFEGGRKIDERTIEYAKEINYRFPFVKREIVPKEIKLYTPDNLRETEMKYHFEDLNNFLKKIFFSRKYMEAFEKFFAPEIYENIRNNVVTMDYFPLQDTYPTFAILKTIDSINKNDGGLFMWLNDFLEESCDNIDFNILKNSLLNYFTARIDIINYGGENNTVELVSNSDDDSAFIRPIWMNPNQGYGTIVQSHKCSIDLLIKCVGEGNLKISLRGIDIRDKNRKRFPIYIDFTKFVVDNQNILNEPTLVWHDIPYSFMKDVKNGDLVSIHVEWKPFDENSLWNKS